MISAAESFFSSKRAVKTSVVIPLPVREKLPLEVIYGKEGTAKNGKDLKVYLEMFRNRYSQLAAIIRKRGGNFIPIEGIYRGMVDQNNISVIGMISDIRSTRNGHKMLSIEDGTGDISVLIMKNKPAFEIAETLVLDEVCAFVGGVTDDKRMLFANTIIQPDVPMTNKRKPATRPCKAALVSDIHVGSNTFLPEAWDRFIDWLAHSDVNYLLCAGDLVDGIGIYPGQELELTIPTIYGQYEELARLFARLPEHITVVLAPGNHDVVRIAEPQPALPEKFRAGFPPNCIFVENPCIVDLCGVKVLMYHGKSFDDLIRYIPGLTYNHIDEAMVELMVKRHLSPIFGEKTPLIAAKTDNLVISTIPDILHTGHVHISAIKDYKGVLCINAGTWQSQTAYQRQFGTVPTPGEAVIVDLQTYNYEIKRFV